MVTQGAVGEGPGYRLAGSDAPAGQPADAEARPPVWRDVLLAIGRRLAQGALTLVGIIYLAFLGLEMARTTPFRESALLAGERTLVYLGGLVRGDLGFTIERGISRLPVPVVERLPLILTRSFGLLLTALLIAAVFGTLIGLWAATRRHSHWPLTTIIASTLGISLPSFFLAFLLQLGLITLNRASGRNWLPLGGFGWDEHLILPAVVLAFRPLAQLSRVTFVTLSEILSQDYIRTALGKGLRPLAIMLRHVIRNAAVPVLTTIGLTLRFSLSSLPIVEYYFGWQGLGFNLLRSISTGDDNLTVAMLLSLGLLFILINLILELAYRLVDPRLRGRGPEASGRDRFSLLAWLRTLPDALRSFQLKNPLVAWRRKRQSKTAVTGDYRGLSELAEELPPFPEAENRLAQAGTRRAWLRGTLGNLPFLIGGLMVLGLLAAVLFGAELAPQSPYTTRGLTIVDGEFIVPPFAPDDQFAWGTDVLGRDLFSLLLAGTQQTFVLAGLVLLARLLVGFVLGAAAGWWRDSWLDRLLMSSVETIATFPTLLLAMTLILALDIRDGFRPFVIALCFVGWGEVMQFVRGEVIRIRPKLFIEGAMAVGVQPGRILTRHVLPNLIPTLVSISALELGSVLMLLGELGFIGIFIGGGIFAELSWQAPLYHYSDVPEWGALLSNVRTYARAYPWMGLYPGLAFFTAILGLNLFGEGLRRLIERVGVRFLNIFNRYSISAAILAVLGFLYLRGSTGAIAVYARQARTFDGAQAATTVEALIQPAWQGRALDTPGMDLAADFLAARMAELGLQPAGVQFSYFQPREREYFSLDGPPRLSIQDSGAELVYRQDFNEYPTTQNNQGQVQAEVRFLAFGDLTGVDRLGYGYFPALDNLDYRDDILLLFAEDARYLRWIRRAGQLVIADDPEALQRRYTLESTPLGRNIPSLWISEEIADRILAGAGLSVAEMRERRVSLDPDAVYEELLGTTAALEVSGTGHSKVEVKHVIGHMPSYTSSQFGGLDDRMILVLAQYDCPPPGPTGQAYPCANDNASGVAVLLEVVRNMQVSGYQPYKTFLFVAYSGEGKEGGEPVDLDEVRQFLEAKYGFAAEFDIEAVIELRGLGAADSGRMLVTSDSSQRLADLFESAARRMGVPVRKTGDQPELNRLFESGSGGESGQSLPRLRVSWEGWETTSHLPSDDQDRVSADELQRAGRAVSLALMILGREIDY